MPLLGKKILQALKAIPIVSVFLGETENSSVDAYIHTLMECRELYLLVFISTFPAKVNTAFALQAVELGVLWWRGGRICVLWFVFQPWKLMSLGVTWKLIWAHFHFCQKCILKLHNEILVGVVLNPQTDGSQLVLTSTMKWEARLSYQPSN